MMGLKTNKPTVSSPTPSTPPERPLEITRKPGESDALSKARAAFDPAVRAVVTSRPFIKPIMGEHGVTECLEALSLHIKEVKRGNLEGAERTLLVQAGTLDAIFNEMARRAAANMGEYLLATETYLRLALKAQSQCRATLETLAAIKNPPVIFAKQANVTTGPQQINNGATVAPRAPAAKNSIQPIQLSGVNDELSTNARASSPAIPDDTSVEAVATVDWAEDTRRSN